MALDWRQLNAERLAPLHPLLQFRVQAMLDDMFGQGVPVLVVQALRTFDEQAALYAQGRTAPGNVVTKARPGYSSHNFGLAVDVCPSAQVEHPQPDWNIAHAGWKTLLATAPKYDLAEGAQFRSFPDNPHLYLRELSDTPTDAMRAALQSGGLTAVWNLIATQLPAIPTADANADASANASI